MAAVVLSTKIKLDIVTPDRLLLSEEVEEVTVPGSEGYLGILPGHLPLLTTLGVGIVSYHRHGLKYVLAASGGFVEVLPDRVILMAESIERPEEIDVQRAREAKERAEKRFSSKDPVDIERAMAALMRAIARIRVAEYKQ